jgi:hypothetical protein
MVLFGLQPHDGFGGFIRHAEVSDEFGLEGGPVGKAGSILHSLSTDDPFCEEGGPTFLEVG